MLSKRKLGLDDDSIIDILDLRVDSNEVDKVADGKKYFAGYHMNKKHWIAVCLDESVALKEIYRRIDDSFDLALK